MTWTLSAAWVFIQSLSALVALTVITTVEMGIVGWLGLALWVFGFGFEVLADHQKTNLKLIQPMKVSLLLEDYGISQGILIILVKLFYGLAFL